MRRLLIERGATAVAVDHALVDGRVGLLAIDRLALPGEPRYTAAEMAAEAGLSSELTSRLWQALGFPAVAPDEVIFNDRDLEALTTLRRLIDLGITDGASSVHLARVMGSAMARLAEAEVGAQPAARPTEAERLAFADQVLSAPDNHFDLMAELIVHVWRRHLQAAVRRALTIERTTEPGAVVRLAVGFADLVGYTALSQQLSDQALGNLVSRFEEVAHDVVTAGGGRVVKMIGDEVMFVVADVAAAARIALALADVFSDDDVLSDVRVGMAVGGVLSQDGDYYGPVVNLASRLVNVAYPGTVVVSTDVHDALVADTELGWQSLRTRHLKDLGSVPLWALRRVGDQPRSGRRLFRPLRTLLSESGFQRAERRGEP